VYTLTITTTAVEQQQLCGKCINVLVYNNMTAMGVMMSVPWMVGLMVGCWLVLPCTEYVLVSLFVVFAGFWLLELASNCHNRA
jgi:uncharacterized membrane protein